MRHNPDGTATMSIEEFFARNQRRAAEQAARHKNAVDARIAQEVACAESPEGHDWQRVNSIDDPLRFSCSKFVCAKGCGAERIF